ncbi:MAG: ATP-binding protein [Burkholderiaceae bacterium]|nr:ATP-binding protein [Burkholderiaceae bacterium]MDO9090104.1 ATP-binding protein [Burkholderiaceae bacterium]
MRLCVLGAESTGKSELARALAAHFVALGRPVALVTEELREWCARAGRTPLAHEQLGIAQAQAQHVEQALLRLLRESAPKTSPEQSPPTDPIVIADTTPLMIAVYSELLFQDLSLYDFALAHQRMYDVTLLTGLDLPWVADGLMRDGAHVRGPVDALVRRALTRAGLPFQVIYGDGPRRLDNALAALALKARTLPEGNARYLGLCETCGDGECEHRLFTALLKSKAAACQVR